METLTQQDGNVVNEPFNVTHEKIIWRNGQMCYMELT